MKEYTLKEIADTRDFLAKRNFSVETFEADGKTVPYFVIPQALNPELPDFAFRMTRTDEKTGEVEGIFGVSDSVPEHLRPWWARHEYEEFTSIGINTKGRCAEAERKVLTLVPSETKEDYVNRRIPFFIDVKTYFINHPQDYTPEDIQEADGALQFLLSI